MIIVGVSAGEKSALLLRRVFIRKIVESAVICITSVGGLAAISAASCACR